MGPGFIALICPFRYGKAKTEIQTILNAQWGNGLIPHIVFHVETDSYFPGRDFHVSRLHPESNDEYPSTGMVQPPVLGFTLKMHQIATDKKRCFRLYQRKY
jgi:hypothetical protein